MVIPGQVTGFYPNWQMHFATLVMFDESIEFKGHKVIQTTSPVISIRLIWGAIIVYVVMGVSQAN